MTPSPTIPTPAVTVVMPCAGEGRRFDAPYPKELHRLDRAGSLVDHALRPVLALAGQGARVRLVVPVRAPKLALVRHLERYADVLEMAFVYQTVHQPADLCGAVTAALPFCSGPTALILPDQSSSDPAEPARFAEAIRLTSTHRLVVVAAEVDDPGRLTGEGALKLERAGGRTVVSDAADKPRDPGRFDAAWMSLFVGPDCRQVLATVVGDGGATALLGAPAVLVDGFINANTVWDL